MPPPPPRFEGDLYGSVLFGVGTPGFLLVLKGNQEEQMHSYGRMKSYWEGHEPPK